jgi:hypothetical protein
VYLWCGAKREMEQINPSWRKVETKGFPVRYTLMVGDYSAWLNQECDGCGKGRVTYWVATIYDESHGGAMEIRSSRAYSEFGSRPFKERNVRNLKRWSEEQLRALCPAVLRDLEAPDLIAPSRTRSSQSKRELEREFAVVRRMRTYIWATAQAFLPLISAYVVDCAVRALEHFEESREYVREIKRYANDVY